MSVDALACMAKLDSIPKKTQEAILTEYFKKLYPEDKQTTSITPTTPTPSEKRAATPAKTLLRQTMS